MACLEVLFWVLVLLFCFKSPHYPPVTAQNITVRGRAVGIGKEPLCAVLLSEPSGHSGCVSAS